MEQLATNVGIGLATLWGLLCGLYVSHRMMKTFIKATRRNYIAGLRRAKRICVDIDAQCINNKQLLCRVTINEDKELLLYVSSDTPLTYRVNRGDTGMPIPVTNHTVSSTIN